MIKEFPHLFSQPSLFKKYDYCWEKIDIGYSSSFSLINFSVDGNKY